MKSLLSFIISPLLLLITTYAMGLDTHNTDASNVFSNTQKNAVEKIVRDYLIGNPKVLIEVSQALQVEQRTEMMARAKTAIKANRSELFTENHSVAGNSKGDVTLVEFFDYRCLHCKRMSSIMKEITDSDKNLKVVYKPLPIFGSSSSNAAKAALAAAKQNKFKAFHQAMFDAKSSAFSKKQVLTIARKAGLNLIQFKKDLRNPELDKTLTNNVKLAQKIGVTGTPAFIIASNVKSDEKIISYFIPGATQKIALTEMIRKARSTTK